KLSLSMQDDVAPKNILMIGSTGVGKTEIARRLAKLVKAPFLKVEATKFTEVGYVGRDVESIVRDLAETAVRMVRAEKMKSVEDKAKELAKERLIDIFVPEATSPTKAFQNFFSSDDDEDEKKEEEPKYQAGRAWMKKRLNSGEMENEMVEIEVEETPRAMMFTAPGFESMGDNIQDMMTGLMPKKRRKRKVTVAAARKIFEQEEAAKLIDMDEVADEAVKVAEKSGIVFLDEIDKVAVKGKSGGADVSREGVQRDILPIVEGSTVMTKYGPVKTDHVLFIAAGAFHTAKPSDLIPELQGRFPIRVELNSLKKEDFKRILTEPKNALIKQYQELLGADDIVLKFEDSAIDKIADLAAVVNEESEDIGARRLHTLLEKLLEDISFDAPDLEDKNITIDEKYVNEKLEKVAKNKDLSQYIL
ncbi:MAG: ATP-dependent protease ATPase subunit HslU, partial [Selenomonadaceae bacterium]|nr:ATP-dependent protease ATPase subunit HslU [Selenomonadaceae bacterium]